MRNHAAHRPITPHLLSLLLSLLLNASLLSAAEPILKRTAGVARRAQTASIGRIFFTPAERRHRNSSGAAATDSAAGSADTHPHDRLIVNGALTSQSRGRAVWLNGSVTEKSAGAAAWADRNGNVWLTRGDGTHLLKPGQSIDHTGRIEDLLPPGSVSRR